MRIPPFIALRLLFLALLPAFCGANPVRAQTDQSGNTGLAERSALESALNITDPASRARALEAFLTRYPNSSEHLTVLAAAMDAFEQAGDPLDAESTAHSILQLKPDDARALALIASADSAANRVSMQLSELPADPLAATICRLPTWSQLTMSDQEVILSLRDVSPCNHAVAEWTWAGILNRQKVFKSGAPAKILSSTNGTIVATVYGDIYNTNLTQRCNSSSCWAFPHPGAPDLQVRLQTPLPYAPPVGAITVIAGTLTGYSVQPFSFSMEDAELPHWSEFGCERRSAYGLYWLGIPVTEYFLAHRDSTKCTEQAADHIWKSLNGHRQEFAAQVVSATAYDMDAALMDQGRQSPAKGWKSPINDLHVRFARPLPFVPQSGSTLKISGVITGYAADPFQFRMEEGEVPELVCEWVRRVGAPALSLDEWLYVLRAAEKPGCMQEAASQVWDAINARERENGGLKYRVHVLSATERVIETTIETQQDEVVELEVRMAQPLKRPPAPGTVIEVKGYLWYGHSLAGKQQPFKLVLNSSNLVTNTTH